MQTHTWLVQEFEARRSHLQAVAYRLLGSLSEAEDAVQETWLHLSRSDTRAISNLGGWLTTVVARVCFNMHRSRKVPREEPLEALLSESIASPPDGNDPEQEALMADAVGLALLVVLNTLRPAERLAFVLHDIFAVPFDEIASIVECSEAAARKLASRARQRVRARKREHDAHFTSRREVVDAFLAASREGDFDALLTLLAPDVVIRIDRGSVASKVVVDVSMKNKRTFLGRFSQLAHRAQVVLVDGSPGVVAGRGRHLMLLRLVITNGTITEIDVYLDHGQLSQLSLSLPY